MKRHAKAIVAISALLLTLVLGVTLANAVAPTVTVENASDVSYTTAKAKGTVDPGDHEAFYRFEAATEADFSNSSAFAGFGSLAEGAGSQPVEADFTELKPGTTYHLRLVAENSEGEHSEAVAASTFTTDPVAVPTVSIDPVITFTGTTAHFSGSIDPNAPAGNPAAFDVDWHFQCTPSCPSLKGNQTIPADSSSHVVEEEATGLDPNTDYEVSLIASNAGGQVSDGPKGFKTEAIAPQVQTLYADPIATDEATLSARVNPRNSPTTYQFEWGTDADYGNLAPASPVSLGATDNSFHLLTAPISGLTQDTTYHFRILATNTDTSQVSNGVDRTFTTLTPPTVAPICPNAAVRQQQGSTFLPECRAYELVTPVDKQGNATQPGTVLDGDRLVLRSSGTLLPDDQPFGTDGFYLARRIGSSWQLSAASFSASTRVASFSPDSTLEVFEDRKSLVPEDQDLFPGPNTEAGIGQLDVYTHTPAGFSLVSTGSIGGNGAFDAFYVGQSDDASHILFATFESLEPIDAERVSGPQLYERTAGQTRVAAILPDAKCAALSLAPGCTHPGGARLGGMDDRDPIAGSVGGGLTHAVSADGSRIFFEAPCPEGGSQFGGDIGLSCPAPEPGDPTQLYVRENGATTTLVSASHCTRVTPVCEDVAPVRFDGAGADGSHVYFRTRAQLIDADEDTNIDLYTYDLDSDQLRGVSVGQQGAVSCPADSGTIGVCGTTAVSDDGRRIYFIATGALVPGAVAGEASLYVYDAVSDTVSLVVGLAGENLLYLKQNGGSKSDAENVSFSPDGKFLVFQARSQLTAADSGSGVDVYRYDAVTGELICVSCGGDGDVGAPVDGMLPRQKAGIQNSPGANRASNRYVTEDGQTVVFNTLRALVPQDINHQVDVYQWHDGEISLITTGVDPKTALLMGISPDGSDVFFTANQKLVPQDVDTSTDVYDARIGGGAFVQTPPLPCAGDGCQGQPSTPPATPAPSTDTFSGPGNVKPTKPRCAKGKVRRKGRCTTRKSKHHRANDNRRASR